MNIQLKKSEVKNMIGVNIGLGYCEAQSLLRNYSRIGYCACVYGWQCDVFANVGDTGVNIVTGYNPTRCNARILTDIERERLSALEDKMSKLKSFGNPNYNRQRAAILREFKKFLTAIKEAALR